MERVYKAGPRCQQLGQTFGLGFKPDPRDLCQIFTRSEIPSEDCLFNYQRRDNSGSARMGGPDDLLTPLARHKRDRNEWRTRYRPPNRASVAYEANLWPIGLDAADYKANIFFRYFAAVSLRVFRMSRRVRKNNTIVVIVHGFRLFSIYICSIYPFYARSTDPFSNQLSNIVLLAYDEREIYAWSERDGRKEIHATSLTEFSTSKIIAAEAVIRIYPRNISSRASF